MKRRKTKKTFEPGTLVRISGTNFVGMSLGCIGNNKLDVFNIFDVVGGGKPCNNVSGKAKVATRKERLLYWSALRHWVGICNHTNI